jgi:hypothetical protein
MTLTPFSCLNDDALQCDLQKGTSGATSSVTLIILFGLVVGAVFAGIVYRISQVYLSKLDLNNNPKMAKKLLNGSRAMSALSAKSKSLTSFMQIANNVAFNCETFSLTGLNRLIVDCSIPCSLSLSLLLRATPLSSQQVTSAIQACLNPSCSRSGSLALT